MRDRSLFTSNSKIETDENDRKVLTVYYDSGRCDWDERIEEAYRRYRVQPGTASVICVPMGGKFHGNV